MKHDIVYVLKNDIDPEELRYSLRSVCLNFPYRKVVFVGGKPNGIEPDIYIPHEQKGSTKWAKSTGSLRLACADDRLTEDIWLFNDDFFVMDKVRGDVNYFGGSLDKKVRDLRAKHPGGSSYSRSLEIARNRLAMIGKDTLDFSLHIPMLVNRAKVLELYAKRPDITMFRSFYGNYYDIDCQLMHDCKVYDYETVPDTPFISTTNDTFKNGKVGEFLRRYFDKPSPFEKTEVDRLREQTKERYTEEGEIRYDFS